MDGLDALDRAMEQAVTIAERGRRTAPPNPWVGCMLVRDGVVVGEGYHERPGALHAEAVALETAGIRARGATAVVTLEPCPHSGRTGPCTDALLDAGVTRVAIALEDPDPRVGGRGIARLRDAGIDVVVGTQAELVSRSLAPYLHHRRTGRAFCVAKVATSVDGRIAAADGSSRWITGPAARADAHRLRADSQAIVVGAGTALADRPALTARDVDPPVERQPLRVLLDGRGRVPAGGPLFDVSLAPTLVLTSEAVDPRRADEWRAAGAKVETLPPDPTGHGVSLTAALELLGRLDVLQALVEGGATVHGSAASGGIADRLVVYLGAVALGARGRASFEWAGAESMDDAVRWRLLALRRLGDDVRLDYEQERC